MTIKISPQISSVDEDVKPIMGKLTCLLLDNGYELKCLHYADGSILVEPTSPKKGRGPRGCCCKKDGDDTRGESLEKSLRG